MPREIPLNVQIAASALSTLACVSSQAPTAPPNQSDVEILVPGAAPSGAHPNNRVTGAAAVLALAAIIAGVLALACGSAQWSHIFIPGSKLEFPGWMAGPLAHLGPQLVPRALGAVTAVMFVAYVVAFRLSGKIPARTLIAVVIVADVIMALAPPLLSADVFGYIGYARLEMVHSLNPYTHAINAAPLDPIVHYARWHREVTPYGPVFTAFTYALAPLGIAANFWALKAVALIASLAGAGLVWRLAERTQVDPRRALVFFALNPLLLVYGLGGAHNDLILMACVLAGFLWLHRRRSGAAAALLVTAVAIKVTAGMYLPFAFVGSSDKKRFVAFSAAAVLAVAAVGIVVFGGGAGAIASQVLLQQKLVATGSVPMQLSLLFGYDHLALGFRIGALCVLLASFVALIVRAQKTGEWLSGAGWTALVLVLTTAWLTPWYILWALPIAAIAGSKRLVAATGVMTAYLIMAYTILPFLANSAL